MDQRAVELFMQLAGQDVRRSYSRPEPEIRKLGAQLLLSELLEYIIKGLGVTPEVNGQKITNPEGLKYEVSADVDQLEALDGLADVAYTMYWNALALGLPLESAFELVCQNNLEKFVKLEGDRRRAGPIAKLDWDCGRGVAWPSEVVSVTAIEVNGEFFAVGKDARGKVRKPSTYSSVDLKSLL